MPQKPVEPPKGPPPQGPPVKAPPPQKPAPIVEPKRPIR